VRQKSSYKRCRPKRKGRQRSCFAAEGKRKPRKNLVLQDLHKKRGGGVLTFVLIVISHSNNEVWGEDGQKKIGTKEHANLATESSQTEQSPPARIGEEETKGAQIRTKASGLRDDHH